jgi:hypothetical protein
MIVTLQLLKLFVVLIPCIDANLITRLQYLSVPLHFLLGGGVLFTRILFENNTEDTIVAKWARFGFALSFLLVSIKHLGESVYMVYLIEQNIKQDPRRSKIRRERFWVYMTLFISGFCNFWSLAMLIIGYIVNGRPGSPQELLSFHLLSIGLVAGSIWGINFPFLLDEIKKLRFGTTSQVQKTGDYTPTVGPNAMEQSLMTRMMTPRFSETRIN